MIYGDAEHSRRGFNNSDVLEWTARPYLNGRIDVQTTSLRTRCRRGRDDVSRRAEFDWSD
jgi:hypothetical protein